MALNILGLTGAVPLTARQIWDDAASAVGGETATQATSADGDEVTLSAEAKGKKAARISELLQQADTAIKTEDVRTDYEQNLASLQSRLQLLFYKNGIDTSQEIRLQTSADGKVVVAGDHPQKEQIEKLFADDPSLRNDFVQVDAQGTFLRAVEESVAFQNAYAEDPQAALERFSYLFEPDYKPSFTLSVKGDVYEPVFSR